MSTLDVARELQLFDESAPLAEAWMPPASWYTSPELLELEHCSVFSRSWQPVARHAELDRPGAYMSGVLAGEPWVVMRGEDGEIRAFANVCRHKGREIVQGSGHASELVCGYHAWRYALDGSLRSAPRLGAVRGFAREQMGLCPLGVCQFGPWVFVHGDPGARPLAEQVPELGRALAESGLGSLTFLESRSWTLRCNWKVYVDNYLDGGYHIPHMHPTLDAQLDMSTYRTEVYGRSSLQTSAPAAAPDSRISYPAGDRIGSRAMYAWIYPNFMLNRYGPCLDSNHVIPRGPDCCEVVYEFFFSEAEGAPARQFVKESMEQSSVTQLEDIAICESVQVGLKSRSFQSGRYAMVEVGEHHFHQLLARDLAAGLAEKPSRSGIQVQSPPSCSR